MARMNVANWTFCLKSWLFEFPKKRFEMSFRKVFFPSNWMSLEEDWIIIRHVRWLAGLRNRFQLKRNWWKKHQAGAPPNRDIQEKYVIINIHNSFPPTFYPPISTIMHSLSTLYVGQMCSNACPNKAMCSCHLGPGRQSTRFLWVITSITTFDLKDLIRLDQH